MDSWSFKKVDERKEDANDFENVRMLRAVSLLDKAAIT